MSKSKAEVDKARMADCIEREAKSWVEQLETGALSEGEQERLERWLLAHHDHRMAFTSAVRSRLRAARRRRPSAGTSG
jgi:ferric-dicitrate binding protein FerR (iron transport regulator)